jgi:long-chain acyl-CoA synthetase
MTATERHASVCAALRKIAAQFPDKSAVHGIERSVTFRELLDSATRFASALKRLGIATSDRVTLYCPNSIEWVITYYGSLMAGAVVNPVNALLTAEEVQYVVRDCKARVVVGTYEKIAPLLERIASEVQLTAICTDRLRVPGALSFRDLLLEDPKADIADHFNAKDLAAICYTSGTTGHPKGAAHTHRNVLMNACLTALMHGRRASDIVVTALPLPHVYGTVALNSTLLSGGTVVLHPRFEAQAILESMVRHRATMFEGVPTMYFYLLGCPDLTRFDFPHLRLCTVGGQSMVTSAMEEVEARFGCPLVELWGMTELAGLGTTFAHSGPVKHGSIGVPLPYCHARIVDLMDSSRELGPGDTGELLIKGPVVMHGYYGQSQATREAIDEQGWLHTGDVARMDDEGFLFHVDRKTEVIVTAGYNVYPAELERVISGHPAVGMVAAIGVTDPLKGEVPKAYIVPRSGVTVTAEEILDYCRMYLAPYKVPRAIHFVMDLPKTSTGKVLRRKLKDRSAELSSQKD